MMWWPTWPGGWAGHRNLRGCRACPWPNNPRGLLTSARTQPTMAERSRFRSCQEPIRPGGSGWAGGVEPPLAGT